MSENAPADGPSSPLATVAETFRKLWWALATIPSEAINDPRHPRWDESFRRAGPLAVEFEAAVSEARRTPGVLAPVAGDAIRQAESLVAELVERLIARSPNRLPGLLAPECIRIGNALKNLAAMQPTSIPTAERSQEAPQTDARGRGAEDLRQDAEPPPPAQVAVPVVTQQGSKGPQPDGPFDADGFRFGGVEVRFRRAVKQYRLVLALWNSTTNQPAGPRPVQDVITDVWGEENDTEDAAFRQLCAETRGRFQKAACPLGIRPLQGTVQLACL